MIDPIGNKRYNLHRPVHSRDFACRVVSPLNRSWVSPVKAVSSSQARSQRKKQDLQSRQRFGVTAPTLASHPRSVEQGVPGTNDVRVRGGCIASRYFPSRSSPEILGKLCQPCQTHTKQWNQLQPLGDWRQRQKGCTDDYPSGEMRCDIRI